MYKNLLTLGFLGILCAFAVASYSQQEWVSFDPLTSAGTPPIITILECDDDHTLIDYKIPGMWRDYVIAPGGAYDRISLPDYATTFDIGYPEIPVVRNLVAVPYDSSVQVNLVSRDTIILDDYDIYPYQEPMKFDEYESPGEFNDYVNYPDDWYPGINPTISSNCGWRQLEVVNLNVNPIRYNSSSHQLEVATHLVINVTYDQGPGGTGWQYGTMSINQKWADIFRTLVVNYDDLGITQVQTIPSDIYYLIYTNTNYYDLCISYSNWIHNTYGFEIGLAIWGYGADALHDDIIAKYDYIESLGKTLDYVLLVGVPSPTVDVSYTDEGIYYPVTTMSDQYLSCIDGADDYLGDLAIGRISYDYFLGGSPWESVQLQFEKNELYSISPSPSPGWTGKSLLVAHRPDSGSCFSEMCDKISEYDYSWINPEFIKVYGTNENHPWNPTNGTIAQKINNGVATVIYTGEGTVYDWDEWTRQYVPPPGPPPEIYISWASDDIQSLLTNAPKFPVVFNVACNNGHWSNDSLAESWVIDDNGAVASVGSTDKYFQTIADWIAFNSFKGLYDIMYGPEKGYGAIIQWSVNQMITKLGYFPKSQHDVRCTTLFGDPALIVKVSQPILGTDDFNKEKTTTSVTSPYVYSLSTAYPNPVTGESTINYSLAQEGEVKIKLFDISGRLVGILVDDTLKPGEYQTKVSSANLSSGVYITKMESGSFSATKSIVVVK